MSQFALPQRVLVQHTTHSLRDLNMFHDIKSSPMKGKAKEKTQHWHTGWWDFYPLAERAQRPLAWSQSSVIFTAHPTQPLLTARHFSSSKQFVIPSPTPVITSPGSYEPPSIISISPSDDWLFAYYPRRDSEGTGCLWKRGAQIDNWNIKEWWNCSRGTGVIAADWLGMVREWATNYSGSSVRLPPRGPRTPISSPTLLLVTQDHQVHVRYLRHYISSFKFLSCSLEQHGVSMESQSSFNDEKPYSGSKQCIKAAIGLGYNESSILIATRSYSFPPSLSHNSQFGSVDLTFSTDMTQHSFSEAKPMEWEGWGEESAINLWEIQIRFDGVQMSLIADQLPPIHHTLAGLVNFTFICTLPCPPSSDSTWPQSPRKNSSEKGHFYLAVTYLDFKDYTSTPESKLVFYSITRQPSTPSLNLNTPVWISRHDATRSFFPGVLTFVASSSSPSEPGGALIYAGILDTSGTLPKTPSKSTRAPVGTVKVLKLPDLSDNEQWESSSIISAIDKAGRELPLNAVLSPNGSLLCTISSSLWPVQTSIHLLPRRKSTIQPAGHPIPFLASVLASATLSRRASVDITHTLSLATTPMTEVADTLYHTLSILDRDQKSLPFSVSWEILGLAMEIYRARALHTTKQSERDVLMARSKAAHDICSLVACNMAFEDCKEGETFDLEAVWQLIGLSSWVVAFTEQVMRECVLSCDVRRQDIPNESNESNYGLFGSGPSSPSLVTPPPTLDSPVLLHLVHPFALQNFSTALAHVKKFREYLGSLSASGENAQIARDVLMDLVDFSGIDFAALDSFLADSVRDFQTLEGEDCRRGLALCQPTPRMHLHLQKVIQKLTQSTVMNKSVLFIKPLDLMDGVARPTFGQKKEKKKDVVLKGTLTKQVPGLACLRCGGISEVGIDTSLVAPSSGRWRAWEKAWSLHCICGGSWTSGSDQSG